MTFGDRAREFLAHRHIAVAGVSRAGKSPANAIARALRENGYYVYPINPHVDKIEDEYCYPNLDVLPSMVDRVIIVTSPEVTLEVVRQCPKDRIRYVWMHNNTVMPSSVSQEAVDVCHESGIDVIAGGCPLMFFDFGHRCMRWMLGLAGRLPN